MQPGDFWLKEMQPLEKNIQFRDISRHHLRAFGSTRPLRPVRHGTLKAFQAPFRQPQAAYNPLTFLEKPRRQAKPGRNRRNPFAEIAPALPAQRSQKFRACRN